MTEIDNTLYIDIRESKKTKDLALIFFDDIKIEKLEVGDILVKGVIFENKYPEDFVSSIFDGRLFTQIFEMTQHYQHAFILIHGNYRETQMIFDSRARHSNFDGIIASCISRGVTPLFTGSLDASLRLISIISDKMTDGKTRGKPVRKISMRDRQMSIVCSLPGISEKRAHDLLSHFHSITDIINAPVEELVKVPGIGPKIANRIVKLNRKTYKG